MEMLDGAKPDAKSLIFVVSQCGSARITSSVPGDSQVHTRQTTLSELSNASRKQGI